MRSQNLLYRVRNERPVQMHAYVKTKSLFSALALMMAGLFFGVFVHAPFGIGQWLLLTVSNLTKQTPVRMRNKWFKV